MSDGRKQIQSLFTGRKIRRAWNKTGEKYMAEEGRQNLAETNKGSYYNQEEWVEEFLDDEGAFYNGSEYSDSDDSDNDDENYNENEQQQLSEGFANNCYKITNSSARIVSNFAVCKHCNGTFVASSNGFGRLWNVTFEKENCLSNSLKARPITPKQNRYFEINRATVLGFRSIGKGHSGAKKVASILNIDKLINAHSCRGHTEGISVCSEKTIDVNLELETHNAKLYLYKTGQLNITENELNDHNVAISAGSNGSWNTQGWSSRTGIVDVCFEPTGKVLDAITKFSFKRKVDIMHIK